MRVVTYDYSTISFNKCMYHCLYWTRLWLLVHILFYYDLVLFEVQFFLFVSYLVQQSLVTMLKTLRTLKQNCNNLWQLHRVISRPRCGVSIIVMCDRYIKSVCWKTLWLSSRFLWNNEPGLAGIFLNKLLLDPTLAVSSLWRVLEFSHPNRALMLLSSCLELFTNIVSSSTSAQIFILKKQSYYIREGTYWAEETNGTIVHH